MAAKDNKEITRQYFKAYEKGNANAPMRFIGPAYTLHPGANGKPMSSEERKNDETVFFSAFSSIKTKVEDQIAEGDKVAARVTMRCVHTGKYHGIPATGKRITIPYIEILKIKAGKIVEEWVEFDTPSILEQIGVKQKKPLSYGSMR